jgi:hypothetical protein
MNGAPGTRRNTGILHFVQDDGENNSGKEKAAAEAAAF